jgi:hypothetical protein
MIGGVYSPIRKETTDGTFKIVSLDILVQLKIIALLGEKAETTGPLSEGAMVALQSRGRQGSLLLLLQPTPCARLAIL